MKPSASSLNPILYLYLGCSVVLFLLGVAGFARYSAWHNLPSTPFDWVYLTLQLIPMNSGGLQPPIPLELELARFFIPLLTAAAAVQAFLRIFREQVRALKLPWLRRHIIICGLSRKGFLLAGQFRRQGSEVVVIEQDETNPWLESCREQGIFVLMGDATDPTLLSTAGAARAQGLFAVCENDGVNTAIGLRAQGLNQQRKGEPLVCQLHISDPQLCDLLHEQEAGLEQVPFQLELFNIFERAARQMLQEYPAWNEAARAQASPPHILIVGLGRMGENLALYLARAWWSTRPRPEHRLRITVIDRSAQQKSESLLVRNPQMERACQLTALPMEVHSPAFEKADFLSDVTAVYICVDDDTVGLHAGLTLSRRSAGRNIPVVVRMAEESGLARIIELRQGQHSGQANLHAFGYLDHTCTPDLLKSTPRAQLARDAHEEYRRQALQDGQPAPGDPSLKPWDQLDGTYRRANDQWAGHIPLLLEAIGYRYARLNDWNAPFHQFSPEQVEAMARCEHELWWKDRLAEGWRYAPGAKDLRAKTSPALVSWDGLSEDERAKNRALVSGIPFFLGRAGYQVIETGQTTNGNPPA